MPINQKNKLMFQKTDENLKDNLTNHLLRIPDNLNLQNTKQLLRICDA